MFDYDAILNEFIVSYKYLEEVSRNLAFNERISEYFMALYEETGAYRHMELSALVYDCFRVVPTAYHRKLNVADITRMFLCHNRFCFNCQKLFAASRLTRFGPVLDAADANADLYHTVFTVPNVPGVKVEAMKKILFEAFARLIRFLNGTDKIKGIDFSSLGFTAALRSLEITYNNTRGDWHPHLHTIFALKKHLDLPKKYRNNFSFTNENGQRKWVRDFSQLEIFLQKIWRVLVDQITAKIYKYDRMGLKKQLPTSAPEYKIFPKKKIRGKKNAVTLDAINAISEGYSVVMNIVDTKGYHEVFKYAFSVVSDENELMTYEQFKVLYYALKGAKTIQGYGAWLNLKIDDRVDDSLAEFYEVLRAYLRQIDPPQMVDMETSELPGKIKNEGLRVISGRKIQKQLNNMTDEDKQQVLNLYERKDELLPPDDGYKPKPSFYTANLAAAFIRYWAAKDSGNPLFRSLQRVPVPEKKQPQLILTEQQLDFFGNLLSF